MKPILVDAHCHIHSKEFDEDRDEVIRRAEKTGVKAILTSSINFSEIRKASKVAGRYEIVYLTIGWDPANLDRENHERNLEILENMRERIVGIGEVGLDYYRVRDEEGRKLQRNIFIEYIGMAEKLKLPLIIHSRSAGRYVLEILEEYDVKRVHLHAFDGSKRWVRKAVELGYYLSIPTSVVYSRQKMNMVGIVPLEQLLLETDSPVLSPYKGMRNEPAFIVEASRKVAEIKNMSEEEVRKITGINASKFFRLYL
ncbi:DNase [Candidatus Bathyarchaeota archaeon ex4484_205]|nr:MAG: DNase [Candidatus Bathyarchaeota archaeon ex4484_205]